VTICPQAPQQAQAWVVWPARAEHHCGYIYARNRRLAHSLALGSDPYRGPSWYLFEVRRLPELDGLCDPGTTIWERSEIPAALRGAPLHFDLTGLLSLQLPPRKIQASIRWALQRGCP